MDAKVVGFYGAGCFDLAYYLAKVGSILGKNVNLVDWSGEGIIKYLSGIDSADPKIVVDCGGFGGCESITITNDLDYVFIYLGTKIPKKVPCEELYLVTDCQLTDIARLKQIPVKCAPYVSLVCRRIGFAGKYQQFVENELHNLIAGTQSFCMQFNATDEDSRTRLLYEGKANKVSADVREFIIKFYSVDFSSKEIRNACKEFTKGK